MESAYKDQSSKSYNLSWITFPWFMIKFIRKCSSRLLTVADLPKVSTKDTSSFLTRKLEFNWNKELEYLKKDNAQPNLLRAIRKTFGWSYMQVGLLFFCQGIIFRPLQALALYCILTSFSETDRQEKLYMSSLLFILFTLMILLFNHYNGLYQRIIGMRIRIALSSLIYKKILNINQKVMSQSGTGEVVNLLSVDVGVFDLVVQTLNPLWVTPFQVILYIFLLWQFMRISCLVAIFTLIILSVPANSVLSMLQMTIRKRQLIESDIRMKLISSIIFGIQTIKMYAWEKPFVSLLNKTRLRELNIRTKLHYIEGFMRNGKYYTNRLSIFFTLVCYSLIGNTLVPSKVFTMTVLLATLQMCLVNNVSHASLLIPDTILSIKRIEKFLLLEEKHNVPESLNLSNDAIELRNVYARWTPMEFVLKNITLKIPKGCFCAIVGQVGSGKSTLLQIILKELEIASGTMQINGKVSYVSQKPWLFSGTVKNNILFGRDYKKREYEEVVKICSLTKDLQQLPKGDECLVGERGVTLSGGQKARINLARAIYQDADIYVFDDPLSALDMAVNKDIFSYCFKDHLKNKTRILVTNQIQHLEYVDYIIVFKDGEVFAQSTFEELSKINDDLFAKNMSSITDLLEESERKTESSANITKPKDLELKIIKHPFLQYIKSAKKNFRWFCVFLLFIASQVFYSASDYWIRVWTEFEGKAHGRNNKSFYNADSNENRKNYVIELIDDKDNNDTLSKNLIIYIYTFLIFTAILLSFIRIYFSFSITNSTSKNIHTKVLSSVLGTSMKFFESHSSGDILSRFSKDMHVVDESFPAFLCEFLQILLLVLGFLVNIAISDLYGPVIVVILIIFLILARKSATITQKQVKHLEAKVKSKMFSHVNATIEGLVTIRACNAEYKLQKQFNEHQDVHTTAWYLCIGSIFIYAIAVDLLNLIFIMCNLIIILLAYKHGVHDASWAGLLLTQMLNLQGYIQLTIKLSGEVCHDLASIERVFQYCYLQPEELEMVSAKVIEDWPKNGLIEFVDLCMKYKPQAPYSLRNLNFTIHPGEKIGIVGRTGAGKSSLIRALFRLSPIEGSIIIDKVNTKTLSLSQLRKSISIIPQDAVLYNGSIRFNLDPFNEYSDSDLWQAIKDVELGEKITSLDENVTEGGSNFSFGERQLFCLVRAIIKNNPILILDEATANIDHETDVLIQRAIKRNFHKCTVLTIAHRLNTVIDSDRILVMEDGQIVEFDHPHVLLQKPQGYFTQMVMKMGSSSIADLKEAASEHFHSNI